MNYTSIEQSKKLLELGLSPESADMCYQHIPELKAWDSVPEVAKYIKESIAIPCWSIGALLKMALVEKFEITPDFDGKVVIIPEFRDENGTYSTDEAYFTGKELIDAFYEMVVWLLEHDYIKKNV